MNELNKWMEFLQGIWNSAMVDIRGKKAFLDFSIKEVLAVLNDPLHANSTPK